MPHLDISNESIKYYASLINYYSVFQMGQLDESLAHIYLLCFVYHRYQKLHDNLINCFIFRVRQLLDEAKSAAKERVYLYRLEHNRNLHKAGQVLKLFADDTIDAATPFGEVKTKAFAILPEAELTQVADRIIEQTIQIRKNLVIEEWENMQRIMVSLALKTTTQFIIIGKLSAYARKNKTKRALWEYDNIIRSLYFLNYVDLLSLRRYVQQAVNRGESYHKFHRAVSHANFGRLRFKTEGEQQIWNECGRLIANCIIFYNATILSNVLRYQTDNGRSSSKVSIEKVSPIAWQHINFYGRFEFTKSFQLIDIVAIVQELLTRPGASPPRE